MIKPVICEKREGVQYLPRLRQMMAGDFQEMKPGPPPLRPPSGPQGRAKGHRGHPMHHPAREETLVEPIVIPYTARSTIGISCCPEQVDGEIPINQPAVSIMVNASKFNFSNLVPK